MYKIIFKKIKVLSLLFLYKFQIHYCVINDICISSTYLFWNGRILIELIWRSVLVGCKKTIHFWSDSCHVPVAIPINQYFPKSPFQTMFIELLSDNYKCDFNTNVLILESFPFSNPRPHVYRASVLPFKLQGPPSFTRN